MNICVCIKQVPDTNEIKVDPVTHTLVRKGVPSIVNPFDTYAQEVGVRLKEKLGGKVVVISMGPEQAKEAIKTCLSVGADAGYLISSRKFGGSDTLATSYILSEAIKAVEEKEGLKFDLILCGKQAVDGDTAQVGPQIAEHLGLPVISYAQDIKVEGDKVIVQRQYDDRYHVVEAKMPCLITALSELNKPRYMTPGGIFDACKAGITTWGRADLKDVDDSNLGLKGSPTKIAKASDKVRKGAGEKIVPDSPEDGAAYIVAKFKEKHII